jgi:hypothetical protein
MSVINRTVQTALRGAALQTAVRNMLTELQGMRSEYRMLDVQWPSSTHATLSAGGGRLINGTVDLRDNTTPSTVAVNITFSGLAESMRAQAEADALALSQRHLAPAGGQAGGAVTDTPRTPRSTGAGTDWGQVSSGIEAFMAALPGMVGQARETVEEVVDAARGTDVVKPGTRPQHAPDVAEPIPLWQRAWVRWTLGAAAVGGVGWLVLRAAKR